VKIIRALNWLFCSSDAKLQSASAHVVIVSLCKTSFAAGVFAQDDKVEDALPDGKLTVAGTTRRNTSKEEGRHRSKRLEMSI
jgi:hypothetical protein